MAADSEERQICTTCFFARALDCEKSTLLCFLPSWSTLLFERGLGEEGRFDVAARSTPKTSCQNHKQQLWRPRNGPSGKAAHTRTPGVKEQQIERFRDSHFTDRITYRQSVKLIRNLELRASSAQLYVYV